MAPPGLNARLLFALIACSAAWAHADEPRDSARETGRYIPGIEARARYEFWDGLTAAPAVDSSYDFWDLRLRPYLRYSDEHIRFFFQVEHAGSFSLPRNAANGPGAAYAEVNDGKSNPQTLDVAELNVDIKDFPLQGLSVQVGRTGITDGEEVIYKDNSGFDWVKTNRLSERLVGNWDWTNVGRRYDAAVVSYPFGRLFLHGFAARVLAGGFDYRLALERISGLNVFGVSATFERGYALPETELRIFNNFYFDERGIAKRVAHGIMKLNTTGASLVGVYALGPGRLDALAWGCFQLGKWGHSDQVAFAAVTELGYRLPSLPLGPWLRTGFAYGSGDEDPSSGDHRTFFQMTPNAHKYYGYMDTATLSNLLNVYGQLLLNPLPALTLQADYLLFWLAEPSDSWYAGSGPSSDHTFGYAGGFDASTGQTARLTNGNQFIGSELDLVAAYQITHFLRLEAGYAHFFGAEGAAQVFPAAPNGDWVFAEVHVAYE